MSDMKSKKEVSEAMEKQISEFGDIAKQLNKRMQPMILRMQKTAESAAIKYGMLESDFDEFMSQYKRYFWKRGFITPKDFDDFFSWLCGCRWAESNEPFGAMEIKESDFTLYHEYKELKLNPSGWNDHQESERLAEKQEQLSNDFEALFKFQNFLIPKVPIKDVYNHFKILTETTNKFNEFYLTNEQLYFFIKSTFIDKKPERKKFNGIPKPKKIVRKVFYEFYVKCGKYETNQTSIKRKYFNIMNDAFEGFNEKSDYNDFHKT